MSERRPSFEHRRVGPEVEETERFADETRRIFRDIESRRERERNPLTPEQREILEKVLLKLGLKSDLEDAMRHADDTSKYQKMKKLGVLLVFDRQAKTEWKSADGTFELEKGDSYIDVHLPPISKERRAGLLTARDSFRLLARYIQEQKLEPKYIMGVTYEKLAGSATKNYGFETTAIDIPKDLRAGVERVYARFREAKNGEAMGQILLCFQTREDFIARFGM